MNKIPAVLAVAVVTFCTGCETESPYFDSQLGTASAHLIQAQTLDPATAANPAALAPAGANGERIKSAVDNYHKDVPSPQKSVERPIVFEVGGSGASGGGGGG